MDVRIHRRRCSRHRQDRKLVIAVDEIVVPVPAFGNTGPVEFVYFALKLSHT
jgi:hypothetical protein